MKRLNQNGSHLLGIALLVLALGVVAFAGYTVSHRNKEVATTTLTSTASVPKTINNKADLNQASTALDNSSAQLDSSLNDSSLNADMNDLL